MLDDERRSATVIAVDNKPAALALASSLGAHHTVAVGPDAASAITDLTPGRGVDATFDLVGSEATLTLALATARALGDVGALPGHPAGPLASTASATTSSSPGTATTASRLVQAGTSSTPAQATITSTPARMMTSSAAGQATTISTVGPATTSWWAAPATM